jgi:hypothetical protein
MPRRDKGGTISCPVCAALGVTGEDLRHRVETCPNRGADYVARPTRCSRCGEPGHNVRRCPQPRGYVRPAPAAGAPTARQSIRAALEARDARIAELSRAHAPAGQRAAGTIAWRGGASGEGAPLPAEGEIIIREGAWSAACAVLSMRPGDERLAALRELDISAHFLWEEHQERHRGELPPFLALVPSGGASAATSQPTPPPPPASPRRWGPQDEARLDTELGLTPDAPVEEAARGGAAANASFGAVHHCIERLYE